MVDVRSSFEYKTISSESFVEDLVVVEVAFAARAVLSTGISAVDAPTFVRDLLFASFDLAESEASLGILFGATVAKVLFAVGKISFVRLRKKETFEVFAAAEEELFLGAAFLEAFVGAGGRGLIFNSESGSTPAPIGLQ